MVNPDEIERFFHDCCDLAFDMTMPHFRADTKIANKETGGFDPVTEADKAAETAIRQRIHETWPEHGIHGEEHGVTNPKSRYRWIIDPIDGTRAFISGLPVWGTLVGLYVDGMPTAGLMYQPFTGEKYISINEGSFLYHHDEMEKISTSMIDTVSNATIMTTSPALFKGQERQAYDRLEAACKLPRYGCDCYAYVMLASGNVDLVVESGLNVYDIAALIPIITHAGGIVTSWDGKDASQGGRIIAAANTRIHAEAMKLLAGPEPG